MRDVDDILPRRASATSFVHLHLFTFALAVAVAVDRTAHGAEEKFFAWFVIATGLPLALAALGLPLRRSLPVNTALSAALFGALCEPANREFAGWVQTLIGASFGGLAAVFVEALVVPFTARIRASRVDGLRRNVSTECLYVVLYAFGAWLMLRPAGLSPRPSRITAAEGVTLAVCVGATALSFGWELRLRRRVRAILAGRVPGWRVVTMPAGALRDVPTLSWLDELHWAGFGALRAEEPRYAIVRDDNASEGAYRTPSSAPEPYVFVPKRVTIVCVRSAMCVLSVLMAYRIATAFSAAEEHDDRIDASADSRPLAAPANTSRPRAEDAGPVRVALPKQVCVSERMRRTR